VGDVEQAIAAGSLHAHLLRGRQATSDAFEPPGLRVKVWCNVLIALAAAVDALPAAVCQKAGAVPGLWEALRLTWPREVPLSRAYPVSGKAGSSGEVFQRRVEACFRQIVADLEAQGGEDEDRVVELDLADACVVACSFLLDPSTRPRDFKRVLDEEVRFSGTGGGAPRRGGACSSSWPLLPGTRNAGAFVSGREIALHVKATAPRGRTCSGSTSASARSCARFTAGPLCSSLNGGTSLEGRRGRG
jgi:hypothetical protein